MITNYLKIAIRSFMRFKGYATINLALGLTAGILIIAFPIIWYLANRWLQNFAKRDELDPLVFVITALIAVTITLVTISFQTVKAAMTDPVKSLRYE